MICISIGESSVGRCLEALKGIDFAEIRIDKMQVDAIEVKKIFSQHPRLIATCRPGIMDDEKRVSLIMAAIDAGAAFVDIEIETDDRYKEEIIEKARSTGCQVIISYHNFTETPERTELKRILDMCFESGADIAKLACRIGSEKENARMLGLLDEARPVIVTGIGDRGKICRIVAPLLGCPFTYASPEKGKETAKGQLDKDKLERIIKNLKNV